jgi:hypothetical protein
VIVGTGDPALAAGALSLAVRVARADGGVVESVLVLAQTDSLTPAAGRARLARAAAVAGADGTISTTLDRSVLDGAMRAGVAAEASLVLVVEPIEASEAERDAARAIEEQRPAHAPPLALVRGSASRLGVVRTLTNGDDGDRRSLASELAHRLANRPPERLDGGDSSWETQVAPGDVTFVGGSGDGALATLRLHSRGLVVTTLIDVATGDAEAGLT